MHLFIQNSSDKPLYEQIMDQIKGQILSGTLREGDLLPSIRLLAKELRISVITTKRAYDELEREGFVHSVAGKGTFVASVKQSQLQEIKWQEVEKNLKQAAHDARLSGISLEELIEILRVIYKEEKEWMRF